MPNDPSSRHGVLLREAMDLRSRLAAIDSETPSAWAMEAAQMLRARNGLHTSIEHGAVDRIARALDAAREQGRYEREAEIVAYLRTWRVRKKGEPDSACLHVERNADEIERGAGRKEDK